jgi:hypothetical protein
LRAEITVPIPVTPEFPIVRTRFTARFRAGFLPHIAITVFHRSVRGTVRGTIIAGIPRISAVADVPGFHPVAHIAHIARVTNLTWFHAIPRITGVPHLPAVPGLNPVAHIAHIPVPDIPDIPDIAGVPAVPRFHAVTRLHAVTRVPEISPIPGVPNLSGIAHITGIPGGRPGTIPVVGTTAIVAVGLAIPGGVA